MRTDEERINRMHARAAELSRQKRARKVKIMQVAGGVVSFAAAIMLAIFVPRAACLDAGNPAGQTDGMHASIFGDSAALGYIVIAIITFLLGVTITIFCFRLRKWQEQKDKEEY